MAFYTPNGNFTSEKVVAYEVGYRIRPVENVSISLATFYNTYDDLRSININPNPPTPYIFANDQRANSWGFELSANLVATDWWRLRGGYTYLDKKFSAKSPNVLPTASSIEALDPNNQVMLQSIMNISKHLQFDVTGRYVDVIASPLQSTVRVAPYATFDIRLAWQEKNVTFSLQGQNLGAQDHTEFGSRQVPRTGLAKISYRF